MDIEKPIAAPSDDAAIAIFKEMAIASRMLDYTPVLVAYRSVSGDTYYIERADPDCYIWGEPDEDGNVECTGIDFSRHGGEVIAAWGYEVGA